MVGGIAGLAVLVVVVIIMSSGGNDPKQPAKPQPKPAPAKAADASAKQPSKSGKVRKDPDRPAPALDMDALEEAESRYKQANELNNKARKLQNAGDTSAFNKTIREAWNIAESIAPLLEKPMLWQEEAEFEEWKIPASYRPLISLLERLSKLRGRIKRVLPAANK